MMVVLAAVLLATLPASVERLLEGEASGDLNDDLVDRVGVFVVLSMLGVLHPDSTCPESAQNRPRK